MKLDRLGNEDYGSWTTDIEGLTKESIVYSFGVGYDISWDLELIRRYGCRVYAFDPTYSSAEWLKKQILPPEFVFEQVGISTYDGDETFYLPLKEGKGDFSTVKKGSRSTRLPVKTLQTLMKERGHKQIDVLKMDIEGAEFAVLPTIAALNIRQLLVEIHSRFYDVGWKGMRRWLGWAKTKRVLLALRWHRFRCVHQHDEDYTFLKRD
jgi:FkbM family methyltransferase